MAEIKHLPPRPASTGDFGIAIICALTLEADAVVALFDHHWDDDGPPYDKAPCDPNAYSAGAIGRHNVILAHMPGMGKANGAAVAANCRSSFPNIKLAIVVGVCGVVPCYRDDSHDDVEIVLGDVIVSSGVVQYDLGRRLPDQFVQKDTLLDSLGRPNDEIRSLLAKLRGIRGRKTLRQKMVGYLNTLRTEPELAAGYPGTANDRLFEAAYRHRGDGMSCDECGCDGPLVPRTRLEQGNLQPTVHFGLIASGDTVMKSGEDRDRIAQEKRIVAFEMEGAGVWDTFPCVVIKGACDYADSHKSKGWQRYAAATAAACIKAFLHHWGPSSGLPERVLILLAPQPVMELSAGPWFLVPYPRNNTFVGRISILQKLQQLLKPPSQARTSLFGLGGAGKTQIALEYAYVIRETCMDLSVFWVHGSNAERFEQSYTSIALECRIPGYSDPKVQVLPLVKTWLERQNRGPWLMVIDNADDTELFFPPDQEKKTASSGAQEKSLGQYVPECAHGSILVTSRNKQAGQKLAKGTRLIEVNKMDDAEAIRLLRASLEDRDNAPGDEELLTLARRLEHLPLALVQAAAFIEANTMAIGGYIHLLEKSDQDQVDLLSEEFETVGRDSEAPRAVAETWILSFLQIQRQNPFASELFSLMSFFDRQAIPIVFLEYYTEQQDQEGYREIQLQKTLGILKAFSFVTEGQEQSLDIHRLVQLISRKWLAREKKLEYFANQALLVISQAYPVGAYENWITCSKYLPHAYQVLKLEMAASKDEKIGKGFLLHNMALYLLHQGQWNDAERLQLEAVELRMEILGADHPSTLTSMANLASTYRNQGRWEEAEKLDVQVMETSKAKLGADHPSTLTSMANLASTFWNQGRWEEAEKLFVQVMETRKAKLGADHPDTLTSMNNLAHTWKNMGKDSTATDLMLECIRLQQLKLGLNHPDTQSSICSLDKWSGN
ncbi:hypothetical protein PWT90_07397 [Aphanocladium album]|nr:hypothetical protein PWT90_07397 [Aphanocladium album]